MAVRQAAVAGTFYPSEPSDLKAQLQDMLKVADTGASACPKVIIAPHAGYVYSGPVAASAYARLKNATQPITRVVLLGPSHRVGFRGIAATTDSNYSTPLGDIPLDRRSIESLLALPQVGFLKEAHTQEHSLEVHLPFLQIMLGEFDLIPLVVGDAEPQDVARVISVLWGGPETLIVISSDLSHYHDYKTAQKLDHETANKIIRMEPDLKGEEACGCRPVNGLLLLARERGLQLEQVDLRNSGDTAGDHSRVVGYGAWVINEQAPGQDQSGDQEPVYSLAERQQLLLAARTGITHKLKTQQIIDADELSSRWPASFHQTRATFITLNKQGSLRGCIGSLVGHRPLIDDVIHNGISAAFSDPRFTAITAEEMAEIDIHISVLSPPEIMQVRSREELLAQIRPGIDGLIIEENSLRANYLIP